MSPLRVVVKKTFLEVSDTDVPDRCLRRAKSNSDFIVEYTDCCCKTWCEASCACDCDTSTCAESEVDEPKSPTNKWGCDDLEISSAVSTFPPPQSPGFSIDSPISWADEPYSPAPGTPSVPPGVFSCAPAVPCMWVNVPTPVSEPRDTPLLRKQRSSPKPKNTGTTSSHQWPTQVLASPGCEKTTLMLKNLPSSYTQCKLLETLDSMGLVGKYDFVYLPVDFLSGAGFGYGFVNFTTGRDAVMAMQMMQGYTGWNETGCRKVLEVCWSDPHQGRDCLIERYRNSRVMHGSVPVHYKPVLLKDGSRISFPSPTKRIRPPC